MIAVLLGDSRILLFSYVSIFDELQIISQVFADHKEANSTRHLNKITGRITTLKPRTPTVAAAFQESLSTLIEKIDR